MNYSFQRLLATAAVCSLLGATTTFGQTEPVTAAHTVKGQESDAVGAPVSELPMLSEAKRQGALRSSLRTLAPQALGSEPPQPKLAEFRKKIGPALQASCVDCHGPDVQEGKFRVDTLDPNLVRGNDVAWWLEVFDVLSNGEMPPENEGALSDADRRAIVDWLSSEIQLASIIRRSEQGASSFRRMTRYEYNYTLQDLLGLPYEFAKDLPPEMASSDGFQNSSEVLQMSATQFGYFRDLGRNALLKATVRGALPEPIYWGISMELAASESQSKFDADVARIDEQWKADPDRRAQELGKLRNRYSIPLKSAHFKNLQTGAAFKAQWNYRGAKYAFAPSNTMPEVPSLSHYVAVLPPNQSLVVELGNTLPDRGMLKIRIRASRTSSEETSQPSLRIEFGFQASNNSAASEKVGGKDIAIMASADAPEFYEWKIPLSEISLRNPMRHTAQMGDTPNPSEYLKLHNTAVSRGDIQIDYVEITAPVYESWPPESHQRIFIDSPNRTEEAEYAREILTHFMSRAWRRTVTDSEVEQKLALLERLRPVCADFQEAMMEVLATVLSSPKFLYLVHSENPNPPEFKQAEERLGNFELATRLAMFLWCSTPDDELLQLAADGKLGESDELIRQTRRMLADARCERFSEQFVRQWLGMELLDYLEVDEKAHPAFDPTLKEAMLEEPIRYFQRVLEENRSVIDFLHADYAMVNERLANHYGLSGVYGHHFREVALEPRDQRGGLLTQAGLLAMNSDGKDSHPLKRGIWMLNRLLNDPPPPPPPAVPEIDLADPEIAKMTLKERIEDHRNDPACISCHAKIDPWGIAFENYDAVGSWRTQINNRPVDASSLLFNQEKLDGMFGLKQFLLTHRQDQFVRAMVYKLMTFALGRPLTFSDRSEIDRISADLRQQDDGLETLITMIVTSDLFQSN